MMKKLFVLVLVLVLALVTTTAFAQTDKEILFRNIPWGTSYTDTTAKIGEISWWALTGESYKVYSIEGMLGDSEKRYEYTDINIIANDWSGDLTVAGYPVSDISMQFAYKPVNGALSHEEKDSALYAGTYEFEPKNREEMVKDLLGKLSALYGEPDDTKLVTNWTNDKTTYYYWYGANDTALVLSYIDESESTWKTGEKVTLNYVWLKGAELLQQASDTEKAVAEAAEAANYGGDNNDGL